MRQTQTDLFQGKHEATGQKKTPHWEETQSRPGHGGCLLCPKKKSINEGVETEGKAEVEWQKGQSELQWDCTIQPLSCGSADSAARNC